MAAAVARPGLLALRRGGESLLGAEDSPGGLVDSQPMARDAAIERSTATPAPVRPGVWPRAWPLVAFLGFAVLALAIYRGALAGPFISDDLGYIVTHPYTAELSAENLRAIFDPFGPAKLYAANYAPIHLLLTALEREFFANGSFGYHLVNVLVHALNATLLVALLLASGLPRGAALLGGVFFAVHPANVEAVAWASQLKTNAALAFSLGALLALRRHPAWATSLFALGLLTKASAAFALPTAAAFVWAWGVCEPERSGRRWAWLAGWALLFGLYAIPQFASFAHLGAVEIEAFADPWVQLRTIAGVGARYLVMALTSYGVSAFQEPEPALSWLEPWWLLALPAGGLLAWRLGVTLRRRSLEAAWWVAAAASFAPISQLFPFLNPVADRYLYFILPGLIGGVLCAGLALRGRLPASPWRVAAAAAGTLSVFFAVQSTARAKLWQSELRLLLDAAEHYPEGGTASFLRARSAAQLGDVETAVAELRRASERGIDRFLVLESDPGLAPIRSEPAFRELLRDLAGSWIEHAQRRGVSTQAELRMLALAHLQRDELDQALAAFELALEAGGPLEPVVRAELEALRVQRLRQEAAASGRGKEDGHRAQAP